MVAAGVVGGFGFVAGRWSANRSPALGTEKEKLSYAMGIAVAKSLKRQVADVDVDVLGKGLRDALSGKETLMTDAEMREAITAFQEELKQKQAETKAALDERRKKDEAFLADNTKRQGVVTLPSGLQYEVVKKGDGKIPVDGDIVQVHYRGTRVDGTEFESTYRSGQPAMFLVSRALPAWKEALKQMPVGSKWKLYSPAQLAYGQRGLRTKRGQVLKVEPNTPVIFELELLAIRPPESLGPETAMGGAAPAAAGREN